MPTYEYACRECGQHVEVVQSFRDDPLTVCPSCRGQLRKVYGAAGIIFKGSGYYVNDSRKSAAKGADGGAKKSDSLEGAAASTSSSDGGSGGGDKGDGAKGSDGAKSDGAKSDGAKSDGAKSDGAKSDGAKGDGAGAKKKASTSSSDAHSAKSA